MQAAYARSSDQTSSEMKTPRLLCVYHVQNTAGARLTALTEQLAWTCTKQHPFGLDWLCFAALTQCVVDMHPVLSLAESK